MATSEVEMLVTYLTLATIRLLNGVASTLFAACLPFLLLTHFYAASLARSFLLPYSQLTLPFFFFFLKRMKNLLIIQVNK